MSKLTFRNKLILSYLLFYLLPLITLLSVGYAWISKTMLTQALNNNQSVVENTKINTDNALIDIENYSKLLSQKKWLTSLAYTTDLSNSRLDKIDFSNYAEETITYTVSNRLASEAFIYFPQSGMVFSTLSKGMESYEWFTENTFRGNYSINDFEDEIKFIPTGPINSYGRLMDGILYSVPLLNDDGNRIFIKINYFIPYQNFQDILSQAVINEQTAAFIFSPQGIISSAGDKALAAQISENLNSFSFYNSNGNIDYNAFENFYEQNGKVKINGQKYYLLFSKSNITGWVYVTAVPSKIITGQLAGFKILMGIMVIVLSLLGFLLSYLIAIKNYRPLSDIIEKVNSFHEPKWDKGNELLWLDESIGILLDKGKNLDFQIKDQRPPLSNAYLGWLLNEGSPKDPEKLKKTLDLLDIHFEHNNYRCMLCNLSTGENLACKIEQIAHANNIIIYTHKNKEEYIFVINFSSCGQANKFFKETEEFIKKQPQLYYLGIGDICHSIDKLYLSCSQAKISHNYRYINKDGGISFYSDISTSDKWCYFPAEKEYALRNCIKNGNTEDGLQIFDELLLANASTHPISFDKIYNFTANIFMVCIKCANELELGNEIEINSDALQNCNTLQEFAQCAAAVIESLCSCVKQKGISSNSETGEKLKTYITTNLCNANLNLSYIADAFSMTETYMSKYFKDIIGINFLDYLNKERINLAKEQLKQSPYASIADIGRQVGYENDASFRRIFKKYEGITPSQYRNIYK